MFGCRGSGNNSVSVQDALCDSFKVHCDRLAVVDPIFRLTYGEFGRMSAQFANAVLERTRGAPRRIALSFDQNAQFLIALVATLRAGCTYVPLDPRRNHDWNRNIVNRTGCLLVLSENRYQVFAERLGIPVLSVRINPDAPRDDGIVVSSAPDSVACIYSTSGTTGPPKAVCDTHRNLLHNAWRYASSLGIESRDRLSLIQAPIFSGTQSTIFMGLTNGCTLYSFDVSNGNLGELPNWLSANRVTVFHSVPSIFRTLGGDGQIFKSIRLLRIEGDQPTEEDVGILRRNFTKNCAMVVGLGATECGLIRQHFITSETAVRPGMLPMGKPVADMEISIRNDEGVSLKPGEVGEIWVTSDYLASGYHDDEARTHERFPISSDGKRSYRTGDLGYIDDDGLLWLRGRKDRQVKVRGETVDLGEIETALMKLPFVLHALVSANQISGGETALVAHLVPAPGKKPALEKVRQSLADLMPSHLLPERISWLDRLPFTPDGKVDRTALQSLEGMRPQLETNFVAPKTDTERAVAGIWEDVLGIAPIGSDDDLFALGCNSLTIIRFADRARRLLRVDIKLSAIFESPTIAAIANIIDGAAEGDGDR